MEPEDGDYAYEDPFFSKNRFTSARSYMAVRSECITITAIQAKIKQDLSQGPPKYTGVSGGKEGWYFYFEPYTEFTDDAAEHALREQYRRQLLQVQEQHPQNVIVSEDGKPILCIPDYELSACIVKAKSKEKKAYLSWGVLARAIEEHLANLGVPSTARFVRLNANGVTQALHPSELSWFAEAKDSTQKQHPPDAWRNLSPGGPRSDVLNQKDRRLAVILGPKPPGRTFWKRIKNPTGTEKAFGAFTFLVIIAGVIYCGWQWYHAGSASSTSKGTKKKR